jgi:hypothetical protein
MKIDCLQSKLNVAFLGGKGKIRVALIKSLIYAKNWKRLRPCKRQKLPFFLFLRVAEKFIF